MFLDRGFRAKVRLGLLALLVAAAPTFARAQTTSASVSGSVQDAQGGALPGVTVTLTSRTQGNVLTTTTDVEGRFVFPIVRPDTYALQATLQGFKTLERSNVVVSANDKLAAGSFTMEVGSVTEEVTVTSRVTELQSTSGERSFTLESQALTNIANNGRQLFNFATLVPGALSQNTGNTELGSVSGFTVNGQRPNSNNITIDGVANIDTGDNGGNMATTNIDAVSEFKVLTNAYQAEYGRAVGGQLQVVTKSGTQSFHGSGYWYGRRSGWNANTWLNKRVTPEIEPATTSRNDSGYTIGGPVYFPGFNTNKQKLFFFWSQEWQRRTDPAAERQTRVPTALERAGDFSQSVDTSGNLFPYIRDSATGLPCSASNTSGCFQAGGVLGRIPTDRLYAPGLAILNIYPTANFSGGGGLNFTSQNPNSSPRREDLLRIDFQATHNWRITGRYMKNEENILQAYGTTWAGNGSDQLPTPVLFVHPGSNYMISGTGILNSTTSLELSWGRAANSLNYQLQLDKLFRANAGVSSLPLLYPQAVQADYVPWFVFRTNNGRTGNAGQYQTDRGPFTNENITHDVIANLTKVWGSHASKMGFYFQHSFKPQSIFASFNSQIDFSDDSANPFDTGFGYANAATGVFRTYTQANKFAIPEWRYKNFEFYAQDNWKPNDKLTLDYGLRFYYLTPQWDTTLQASNFLPDEFNQGAAAQLYTPVCVGGTPGAGCVRRAIDPALIAQGITPTLGNTLEDRFVGRLTPSSNRFNGAFQAGQGINDELQDGNAFRVSPRVGVVYDLTGSGNTILRGGWGIFYDRPQGNMVFDMIANAPGVLNSAVQWGRLQSLATGGSDPDPTLSLNPTAYDFKPPKVTQWNVGIQHKMWREVILDVAYVGSKSTDLLRQVQINSLPFGATLAAQNQDPTRVPAAQLGSSAMPNDFLRPFRGYGTIRMWDYSGYGNYNALQTSVTRRFDAGFMFSAFYVWSKALGINSTDFSAGVPNLSEEETKALDYSYLDYDRPHNFTVNFIYQTPNVTSSKALGMLANEWQISGVYRWTSGRPYTVNFSIPNINSLNLTGTDNPNARIALTCDPGSGWSDDPYKQLNTDCFAPPQPGSNGNESARFFVRAPPLNNLDLSIAKNVAVVKTVKFEIRLDMFNALNHTQFTGVNATANFASLTDRTITNLPHDASGALVRPQGFGAINGVANPRTLQLVTRVTF
jgi:Carboxypeptidase regulatory-like domain/TonB dependent receptor/TonB-dependent Receptor Plug Domain